MVGNSLRIYRSRRLWLITTRPAELNLNLKLHWTGVHQSLYKPFLRPLAPDGASGSALDEPRWLDVGNASLSLSLSHSWDHYWAQ